MTDVDKIAEILGRERKKCVHVGLPLWIVLKPWPVRKKTVVKNGR